MTNVSLNQSSNMQLSEKPVKAEKADKPVVSDVPKKDGNDLSSLFENLESVITTQQIDTSRSIRG